MANRICCQLNIIFNWINTLSLFSSCGIIHSITCSVQSTTYAVGHSWPPILLIQQILFFSVFSSNLIFCSITFWEYSRSQSPIYTVVYKYSRNSYIRVYIFAFYEYWNKYKVRCTLKNANATSQDENFRLRYLGALCDRLRECIRSRRCCLRRAGRKVSTIKLPQASIWSFGSIKYQAPMLLF